MNPTHVVSLPLAKRLKELGVKQESLFYWQYHTDKQYHLTYGNLATGFEAPLTIRDKWCAAYLASELGELLKETGLRLPWYARGRWWYLEDEMQISLKPPEDNEVNSRAKMLIHLIEQGLVKV